MAQANSCGRIQRALISVADKRGAVAFARALQAAGVDLVSTGGTAKALREAGLDVIDVADLTGFPEIMDGRVKTLHPRIHGGILARRDVDAPILSEHGIDAIDLVVVNLYPFQAVVATPDCTRERAIEHIDIGGVALLRGAAKNYDWVTVVVDPDDYPALADAVASGPVSAAQRRRLAQKAFAHTAAYDCAISAYLVDGRRTESFAFEPLARLRYGENPHQEARLLGSPGGSAGDSVARAHQYQGKALSYNNLVDADAAWACVRALDETAACVIVKHANPCGVATADTPQQAYQAAFATDPKSAFGGILAFNRALDGACVEYLLAQQFVEVLLAPDFSVEALELLAAKPNVRALRIGRRTDTDSTLLKSIDGGLLVQTADLSDDESRLDKVSERQPDAAQIVALQFAWTVVRFVKSNAIVIAAPGRTLGIGAGQTSRVDSVELALHKAREQGFDVTGSVLASDAFFPFADAVERAAEAGVAAIIQPGGSIRDDEVVACANEHGMVMVCTGMRHFRH